MLAFITILYETGQPGRSPLEQGNAHLNPKRSSSRWPMGCHLFRPSPTSTHTLLLPSPFTRLWPHWPRVLYTLFFCFEGPVKLSTLSFTREGCLHQDCRALPPCQKGPLEIPLASGSVRAAWRPRLRALPPSWLSSKNHKKSDQRLSWTTDEQVVPHTDPQLAAAQTPRESLAEWVAGWVGL